MWRLVLTGTSLSLASQVITDKGISTTETQLLALAKYCSLLASTYLTERKKPQQRHAISQQARALITAIGVLDVAAYACQCIGMQLCGAALAVIIFAATSQSMTALLSRLLLDRRLSRQQLAAVVLVNVGLLIRAAAPSLGKSGASGILHAASRRQLIGAAAILAASIGYSLMGVLYDKLVRTKDPPAYSAITTATAKIGVAACLIYQGAFVVPRWQPLVLDRLAMHSVTPGMAALVLAAVGIAFSLHNYCQAWVVQAQGAVALGIANAIRGALVSLVAGFLFCSPERPWQCPTVWTHVSALVVTAGAMVWAVAKAQPQPGHPDKKQP